MISILNLINLTVYHIELILFWHNFSSIINFMFIIKTLNIISILQNYIIILHKLSATSPAFLSGTARKLRTRCVQRSWCECWRGCGTHLSRSQGWGWCWTGLDTECHLALGWILKSIAEKKIICSKTKMGLLLLG